MRLEPDGDLMSVLSGEDFELDGVDITFPSAAATLNDSSASTAGSQATGDSSGLASSGGVVGEGGGGSESLTLASSNLSWPEYLQKFKETFIQAKPLDTVEMLAKNMGFRDWLDYVVKFIPKDVKIQGEVDFRHLVMELGPVDKTKYLMEPVVECEHEVVEEGV